MEIRHEVGEENFFEFGHRAEEVARLRREGYRPGEVLAAEPALAEALDRIAAGDFSQGDRELFRPLVDGLRSHDHYLLCADFPAYLEAQRRVERLWAQPAAWTRSSILNVARCGRFSSDRAVREYCDRIWHVSPTGISGAVDDG